jgi:protein phosphatase
MGTTLVAVLATPERVALAHVGDSRAYLIRNGRIRQLTDDHSLVGELLRRRQISEDDAREHPHRHVLTRALGVASVTQPDLAELTPAPGDTFVLCSDGLTTHLRDSEILLQVEREADLQKVCDTLVASANHRGGVDNVTVVLVRYDDDREVWR